MKQETNKKLLEAIQYKNAIELKYLLAKMEVQRLIKEYNASLVEANKEETANDNQF